MIHAKHTHKQLKENNQAHFLNDETTFQIGELSIIDTH